MPSSSALRIVGLSAYFHDSAAAMLHDGNVIAAAQEERFTRRKHDERFPRAALSYVLDAGGASIHDVDAVAFYEKPLLKFERLMESHRLHAPHGRRAFVAALPGWARRKLFIRQTLQQELRRLAQRRTRLPSLYFPEHHVSHAASAYYPSPFDEAAIVTIDGVGEWATATIAHGRGSGLRMMRELRFPDSLGLFYTAVTTYCGFAANDGEYKLMGLAPFGGAGAVRIETKLRECVIAVAADGSLRLNPAYFDFMVGLHMCRTRAWRELLHFSERSRDEELTQGHADLALAAQRIVEDAVCRMVDTAVVLTHCSDVVMAGGVALNCVANSKVAALKSVRRVWVQPAAGDAGGALGAAYAIHHIALNRPRPESGGERRDAMAGSRLGPEFSRGQALAAVYRAGLAATVYADRAALVQEVAGRLADGAIVGWFQGRMEWGPRALGGRSILADPRDHRTRAALNRRIKGRESFRPFAPVVRVEDASDVFDVRTDSPYMLFVAQVRGAESDLDATAQIAFAPERRLDAVRSPFAAVTHVDGSARVQTLHRDQEPLLWELLVAFKAKTGCPVLLNTSFNRADEPIVCDPEDAVRCFLASTLDVLVLGDVLVTGHE